jgi:hypothetical protein
MKDYITKITFAIVLAFVLTASSFAQDADYIKTQDLNSFNQISLNMDTDVILLKSSRNHLTLVGELDYINNLPITYNGDTLSIQHNAENAPKLRRVVIEYKDISQIETSGNGFYYFHKVDEDKLNIINNSAKLTLNGSINNVRIISEDGEIDASKLKSNQMVAQVGTTATFKMPSE